MKQSALLTAIVAFLLSACCATAQQPGDIVVNAAKVTAAIRPTMWGIFFEDINFAADGGLYAELVKNRSFEFNQPLMGWTALKDKDADASLLILNREEQNADNPRFARITVHHNARYGLRNEGFRGMGIRQGEQYNFSMLSRLRSGTIKVHLQLLTPSGQVIGEGSLPLAATQWARTSASFTATATEPHAQLNIWFEGDGVVDADMLSLFPQHTWKERPGGLRADLVQLLADMRPGFVRFPGGCIVEGRDLANRYEWKKTVGDIADRKLIINRWNTEFANRSTPDYFQSYGLGFFEYFQLAEDIGATPLPILNCGMACQYNTAEVVPVEQLDPYLQDALDLVQFANGDTSTHWGRLRAQLGHPAPFHLRMLGIGNEQWGPQYIERLQVFTRALHDKYPDIQLVNSNGPNSDGALFNYLHDTLYSLHADIIDEHYYKAPNWFLQNAQRYDHYDRNGPKIFAGEYAAQNKADAQNRNTWQCALAEAAFMTGLERNADVVQMASYAPLFAHVDAWQWTPDLIWFDNLRAYGTPNYYVQQLYATNRGTHEVAITRNNTVLAGADSLYAAAAVDSATHELVIKLVNTAGTATTQQLRFEGRKRPRGQATFTVLQSNDPNTVNTLDAPKNLSPVTGFKNIKGTTWPVTLAPWSFTIIRVSIQ